METKQMIMKAVQTEERQATATHAGANNKMAYTPPQIEVIEMEGEGVIATSVDISGTGVGGFGSGGNYQQSTARRGYRSASSSDLEDLINDILTVEQ